ncbi:MAG: amino acid ABC transporter ATP-binding protein [Clostridia bacterium]|nr:amino acid ABC transporter ATP-binding protein [Clostridia bacterium]
MPFLEVDNIRKSFGKTEVLKGISFSIEKGEVLTLIGSSGSGKTTLLRCLNFLETPNEGEIYLDGKELFSAKGQKELSDKEKRERRLHFGLVFQQFNLFPQYTALKNVTLAAELLAKEELREAKASKAQIKAKLDEVRERAADLLDSVGLSDKMNNYPCELSGGQQQRVAIARALALDPEILCFDEPTSALDPELTGEVLSVIKKLAQKNMTMIIVTHEMEFAKGVSDKVIFMDGGVIAVEGTPREVFDESDNERIQKFLSSVAE